MTRYFAGLFAIAEIFSVLVLGMVLGGLTSQLALQSLGVDPSMVDEEAMFADPTARDALIAAIDIGSRFAWLLLIGFLLLRFIHGVTPRMAGVSRGGHSWLALIGAGILLFAFASLPFRLTFLADAYFDFGEGISGWDALMALPLTVNAVLLVIASLAVLPPLVEEPFARGYMRVRLSTAFGSVGGVILCGVIFMLAHGHFYVADPFVLSAFAGTIFAAIAWAWVTYRTGSIIPAFIAHAMTNSSIFLDEELLIPSVIAMIVAIFVGIRFVVREAGLFKNELTAAPTGPLLFGLGLVTALTLAIVSSGDAALPIGAASLVLMIAGWLPPMRQWNADRPPPRIG